MNLADLRPELIMSLYHPILIGRHSTVRAPGRLLAAAGADYRRRFIPLPLPLLPGVATMPSLSLLFTQNRERPVDCGLSILLDRTSLSGYLQSDSPNRQPHCKFYLAMRN